MKYHVKLFPRLVSGRGNAPFVRECFEKRAALRRVGFVIEWVEVYDSWCAEFNNEEEAALFKLTYL